MGKSPIRSDISLVISLGQTWPVLVSSLTPTGLRNTRGWRKGHKAERLVNSLRSLGVTAPQLQHCALDAPQLGWSFAAQPSANTQTGVSWARYITHHRSAVLCSAKHRMARPPGYATGAHVQAGCLPDRQLINTPTRSTVLSKHVSRDAHIAYCT